MEPSLQLLPPELGAFAAALSPLSWLGVQGGESQTQRYPAFKSPKCASRGL